MDLNQTMMANLQKILRKTAAIFFVFVFGAVWKYFGCQEDQTKWRDIEPVLNVDSPPWADGASRCHLQVSAQQICPMQEIESCHVSPRRKQSELAWKWIMRTEFVPRVNQVSESKQFLIPDRVYTEIPLHKFQLDALQLDHDITRIARDQLVKTLQNLSVNNSIIELAFWKITITPPLPARSAESLQSRIGSTPPFSNMELLRSPEISHIRSAIAVHVLQ